MVKYDWAHLLPNYSFFAPRPLMHDYRLVYKLVSDEPKGWEELYLCGKTGLSRIFLNEQKYHSKAFVDAAQALMKEIAELEQEKRKFIQFSFNYVTILKVLSKNLDQTLLKTHQIRFAIVTSENQDELKVKEVLFASLPHQIIS